MSKTLESLGRSDTVKSVVTSMVVAGALQGLDQFMGWDQAIQGGTLPSTGKLLLTDNATWDQVAQRVASHSIVSSTLGTAIQGGSFIDNFKTALLSNIGSQFHAEGANLIGDNGAVLGHAGKVLSHATLSGLSAQISGGNVNGAVIGSLATEIAAISLGDNTIKAEEWQKKSESQAQFVRLFGGIAGGIFTGEPGGVYSGERGAENSFRYNYLSHHQQKLMEKELSTETNYFKKTAIYLKWLSVDIGQDTGFNAGLIAGIPTGLYETIEGLASLATNPLETYQAIKAVIQSDNAFDTLTQTVKQSYIERIEKLEAEYQKAGVSGSFNAGVESGKLIFDLVGLFAGGAGVAKGSSQLIAKTSAKITTRNKLISSIKSGQVGLSDPDAVDLIKADMLKNFYSYKAPSGIIAGYIDKKGIYYVTEGNHRMVAAVEIYNEIGEIKYINQLLDNGSWTKIENPIVDSKPLPVRKIK
ncbi:DUF637 domain-containing protein [Proteus vulgaris]|uniref:DUF637 domain-containing protein n=1 Tax=Proteus vulgaris TaxID=585 RepID=UPI00299F0A1D|nr:DUF637 domain-containing protein [Proteus vulgaris]WPF06176.1 DUF637 domain-containing protein [Proteus vulgaris]